MYDNPHPLPVRIMHAINALTMIAMIMSGWGIYNDHVIIHGLHFASWLRLGDWAAPSLLWHFAAMWLLAINGLAYLAYGLATGRLRRRLLPLRAGDVLATLRDARRRRLRHDDPATYNGVQKLLYIVVILAGIVQVGTGLCLWKPIQLSAAVAILGGFQAVRIEHFIGMGVIVGFLAVHVAVSILVPKSLWAMLGGGARGTRRGELHG
jgi:thiosulfate reductase cytochrome b subunit